MGVLNFVSKGVKISQGGRRQEDGRGLGGWEAGLFPTHQRGAIYRATYLANPNFLKCIFTSVD